MEQKKFDLWRQSMTQVVEMNLEVQTKLQQAEVPILSKEEIKRRREVVQDLGRKATKADIKANKEEYKKELTDFLVEWKAANPLVDKKRGIYRTFAIYLEILSDYPVEPNDELARLPLNGDSMLHDIAIITLVAEMLPEDGDKSLLNWARTARTSFLLINPDIAAKESLANILYAVSKKIDVALTTMITHIRTVNKKEIKEITPVWEYPDLIEARRNIQRDHEKRGELLLNEFNDLRVKIRRRFGDAKKEWKIKSNLAAETLLEPIAEEKLQEEEILIASHMFRDVDPTS